ncbi:Transcription initiation factor TFIID subunit 13 [Kappamyces sp. JEL0829]|nr:Transcription initiation factor TFIID subunit 13 [Kappamyces sp. JEL0829]KAJ3352999.1 Transcription initiation factor TFIID subunit 13 [Kappamyces sp. JEL0680]
MYGFGDVSQPLQESVDVMDELLDWFVADLCESAAKKSSTTKLKTSDFLSALEGQPKKLARAHELLTLDKELKMARATFNENIMADGALLGKD